VLTRIFNVLLENDLQQILYWSQRRLRLKKLWKSCSRCWHRYCIFFVF